MLAPNLSELLQRLDHPSREYSPIPFWFLNGDLTHREIRRQLRDFQAHGVHGVVLHPRMGMSRRIGYLSPLFFRYLRTAVETAADLGMTLVLYDEGMYPSGSAGGQIVRERPDLASRGILWVDAPQRGDTVLWTADHGMLVERFSGGTLRGIHAGEDDGEPHVPRSADILNPEAVSAFIRLTHEAYAREFRPWFGSTIRAFFTDEPSILGRNAPAGMQPWTRGFAEVFPAAGGHLAGLEALFRGGENADTALYRRLILEREASVYYKALSAWCESHGLALMGHPHQSDDIEVLRYFQIPGQDLVYRWVAPETGGTKGMDSVMGKCGADMARLMGRSRNANECFGACNRENNPWYFTGSDMKWFLDYLAVRGVNLFVPHAFYYSLAGKRSQERPPDVGPGSIWWPHYRQWAAYMARLSCLRTETEEEIFLAVPCRNRDLCPEAVEPLFQSQRAFQYLPESFWPQCREEDGALRLGRHAYGAVLAPAEQFPTVPHNPETVSPVLRCDPPQPDLRAAALRTADGGRCWMLVNEGEGPLETEALLPAHAALAQMDLWTGEKLPLPSLPTPEGQQFHLSLPRRGSLLIFPGEAVPEDPPRQERPRILTASPFTLQAEDPIRCVQTWTAEIPASHQDLLLQVEAEEMVELYVNDQLCGTAFWPPQRIRIPRSLLEKPARLRLVVTGSLANRYGRPVPYGLKS